MPTPQVKSRVAAAQALPLYICAQGGYLGMNGNYSAGILEGVAHYMPGSRCLAARAELKLFGGA